ncbi:MAG: hypothetical protein ABJA35_01680 [Parafilimonas sp.]
MQDLENDMDDLFRKAVENYQVNSGKSNWDKIVPQLSATTFTAIEKKKNNRKKYRVLLLLLVLMIAGGGMLIKFNNNEESILVDNSSNRIRSNDSYKEEKNSIQKSLTENKSNIIRHLSVVQKNKSIENVFVSNTNEKRSNEISNAIYQNKVQQVTTVFNNSITKNIPSINDQQNIIDKKTPDETEQEKLISPGRKYEDTLSASRVNKSNKITLFKKQHGVYFGVITGLSLNKVKNQKLGKPGFDIGFAFGYQFINKVAVEALLSFSKKYYFTEGKYFSMEKIKASMPPEMKVMSVDGSSMLFEIPIKFKYNISNKDKSTFFSSAGLSSYMVIKEKNDYHTLMNGTNEIVTNSYKNSTSYFASAVDVSLGYEHAIGNHNNKIRIEPYVQIPLKKIGVGALPVMSAGLHLGFTLSPH